MSGKSLPTPQTGSSKAPAQTAAPAAAQAPAPADPAMQDASLMGNAFMASKLAGGMTPEEESSLLDGIDAAPPEVAALDLKGLAAANGIVRSDPAAANANASADAKSAGDKKTGFFQGLYLKLTRFHFEGRDEKNGKPPSYEELVKPGSGWKLLPKAMSVFHDNGKGEAELKFVHEDGREAVIDGDTKQPLLDAKYMATYNYVNPMPMDEVHGPIDLLKFAGKNLGHFITDVVPYAVGGNVRGEN